MNTYTASDLHSWTLSSFVDDAALQLGVMGGWMLILMGVLGLIWGMLMLIKKLMSAPGDISSSSWSSIVLMVIVGGALATGGYSLTLWTPSAEGMSPSPTPTPTPEDLAPAEPEPTQDPISLPEIENPAALWTWIGAIVAVLFIAVSVYLFVQKIHRDRVRKLELENQRLEAEAEAQRLAEVESRRQKRLAEQRARIDARWATITDLHEQLKRRVVEAETDWDTLFSLPALTDVSFRQTRALHRAMRDAENAVIPMPAGFDERTAMDKIPYVKKVHAFEDAWKIALSNAQKVGTSKLPSDEQNTIKRIRQLLIMAEGTGASEHERANAYRQIRKLVGELRVLQLPTRAIAAIESQRLLAITAGPGSAAETEMVPSVPRPLRAR